MCLNLTEYFLALNLGLARVLFCSLELLNLEMQRHTINFRSESFFYDAGLGKKNAHDIT
mgnify:FL=1